MRGLSGALRKVLGAVLVGGVVLVAGCGGDGDSGVTASLAWDASVSDSVIGYRVYVGTTSGNYNTSIDVGATTNYTVKGLAKGSTYYFAVTAVGAADAESPFSNEVSKLAQ